MGWPVRFLPAALLFLATFVHYFARVNINIAVISMTEGGCGNGTINGK